MSGNFLINQHTISAPNGFNRYYGSLSFEYQEMRAECLLVLFRTLLLSSARKSPTDFGVLLIKPIDTEVTGSLVST